MGSARAPDPKRPLCGARACSHAGGGSCFIPDLSAVLLRPSSTRDWLRPAQRLFRSLLLIRTMRRHQHFLYFISPFKTCRRPATLNKAIWYSLYIIEEWDKSCTNWRIACADPKVFLTISSHSSIQFTNATSTSSRNINQDQPLTMYSLVWVSTQL